MTRYEIRIVRQDRTAAVHSASLLGDHAAIRRARNLAQAGDHIEVWRGPVCVYSASPAHASAH